MSWLEVTYVFAYPKDRADFIRSEVRRRLNIPEGREAYFWDWQDYEIGVYVGLSLASLYCTSFEREDVECSLVELKVRVRDGLKEGIESLREVVRTFQELGAKIVRKSVIVGSVRPMPRASAPTKKVEIYLLRNFRYGKLTEVCNSEDIDKTLCEAVVDAAVTVFHPDSASVEIIIPPTKIIGFLSSEDPTVSTIAFAVVTHSFKELNLHRSIIDTVLAILRKLSDSVEKVHEVPIYEYEAEFVYKM